MTIRVSSSLRNRQAGDHEATWLLGHTETVTFGRLWRHKGDLFAEAVLHVPCKFLELENGSARCAAHGFQGPTPASRRRPAQPRRLGGDRFRLVERGGMVERELPPLPTPKRSLTVLNDNPCATARCRTNDHRRGAACCRDLGLEIMCDVSWQEQELLVRSRKPPYLCKVARESEESLEAEIISACGYLDDDRVSCTLHGRKRPDGRQAKPDLCRRWPNPTEDETLHPGCVFAITR